MHNNIMKMRKKYQCYCIDMSCIIRCVAFYCLDITLEDGRRQSYRANYNIDYETLNISINIDKMYVVNERLYRFTFIATRTITNEVKVMFFRVVNSRN